MTNEKVDVAGRADLGQCRVQWFTKALDQGRGGELPLRLAVGVFGLRDDTPFQLNIASRLFVVRLDTSLLEASGARHRLSGT
jgi:hypothetical protein